MGSGDSLQGQCESSSSQRYVSLLAYVPNALEGFDHHAFQSAIYLVLIPPGMSKPYLRHLSAVDISAKMD